ncbi:co-chaperone GroES [Candidatus Avelusimicrobium alvi]|mgnify:FL=1|uniref:co-chaperone GroES n=1 Tax=Candidatus Avelusimicrobium alvi TaxID=3416221 RepID=UPI003D139F2D
MAEVKIKPLGDRVIVKPIERETMKGGIIIPDTAKEKPMEGEVLAVGPGKLGDKGERAPMDVKKGDRVLYGKYSGTEIKLDDEAYLIIHQDEILGILG